MWLADKLVWALCDKYGNSISGVEIYCDRSIAEEVSKTFIELFKAEWQNALQKVESEHGSLEDDGKLPVSIENRDYGLFISVDALDIRYCYGDYCDLIYGNKALDNSLQALKAQYRAIEYDGYIVCTWSDVRCGDVYQRRVFSNKKLYNDDKLYDFIGKAISNCLKCEHLWTRSFYNDIKMDDLIFAVAGKLKYFKEREDIIEYIKNLGADVWECVSTKTSYLISNDLYSASAEIKEAKELGIPIITETEFIFQLGAHAGNSIYNIDYSFWKEHYNGDSFWHELHCQFSDFWESLHNQLEVSDEDDFLEVAESLLAYKEWIDMYDLERAFNSMIDIMSERQPEIRKKLKKTATKLLAGKKVKSKPNKTDVLQDGYDNLPDGYMEALDMFIMAEELGGPTPKRGEVLSSEGVFDIVIAKAEDGDPEAKFTAGKYFIADHVEDKLDCAVAWIKEAAEAGVEEAAEYISKNGDLFK